MPDGFMHRRLDDRHRPVGDRRAELGGGNGFGRFRIPFGHDVGAVRRALKTQKAAIKRGGDRPEYIVVNHGFAS